MSNPKNREKLIQVAAEITGFTKHGINRAIERGVSPSDLLDTMRNPIRIQDRGDSIRYIGERAIVVIDQGGSVITVWSKKSR